MGQASIDSLPLLHRSVPNSAAFYGAPIATTRGVAARWSENDVGPKTEFSISKQEEMNMYPKRFALVAGLIMLAMGVFSLIPNFVGSSQNLPFLTLDTSYGLFLGMFAMNILTKVALIGFGLWGIWASYTPGTNLPASIFWARSVAVVMGIAAVLGLIPATNTLFGYWPLFGAEVLVHGAFAILGAYFGYALTSKVPKVTRLPSDFRNPVHNNQ